MKKYEFVYEDTNFLVKQWTEDLFELIAYRNDTEIWKYPNSIYTLRDCSTHLRHFLKRKGLRVKWSEIS